MLSVNYLYFDKGYIFRMNTFWYFILLCSVYRHQIGTFVLFNIVWRTLNIYPTSQLVIQLVNWSSSSTSSMGMFALDFYFKFVANSFVPVVWCQSDVTLTSALLVPYTDPITPLISRALTLNTSDYKDDYHTLVDVIGSDHVTDTDHVTLAMSMRLMMTSFGGSGGDSKMAPVVYALYALAVIILGGWCFVWFLHFTAIVYAKFKLYKKVSLLPRETPYPGVSVLKPLVGIDPNLFSNLETFFTMNYPQFELLFCIHDESDPSIMLVNRLIEKYPNIDARIFVGGTNVGVNPKVNNMQPGYENAKYDLVLVSDSGLRMREDTLLDMVNHMTDNVGLVHQMPFVCDRKGFAATVEKVYFGTSHARIYLVADLLRINCATGMSALMRKNLLDEAGGIKAFGHYLAEDFFFAKSMTDRGWRICISSQPALQNSGLCDITSFQTRITRWTKLRFAMVPQVTVLEPFSECMLIGALASCAAAVVFLIDPLAFYLVHILVWFLLDWIILGLIQNGPIPFSKFDFVIGWTIRECSALILFFKALLDPTIRWRTGTYRLKWGGEVEEVKTKL